MAKNEHKTDRETTEGTKPWVIQTPNKAAELPHNDKIGITLKQKNPKAPEPPHTKHHGKRKFVFFIFLLLLGCVGFLAIQLKQAQKLHTETLQKLQAVYDEKFETMDTRLSKINREVEALKNRPIVEQVAGVSENQVNQKIAALREEMTYYLAQSESATAKDADKNAANQSPASDTTEEKQHNLIATELSTLMTGEKKTQETLLASGAIIVRDLAEQGVSFAYEAEVLQILARGNELAENYVRTIRSFANVGIRGKHQLVRSFEKIFAELNDTRTKFDTVTKSNSTKQNWLKEAWNWLKQTIATKKGEEKPVFVAEDDEVRELVLEGRLQDALNALKISEKYSKLNSKPLNTWKDQVEQYLEFSHAISGLIMNALANIRLKELEHAAE